MSCTVLGGGVSGLSTGIRLLEMGLEVRLVAERLSPETVSDTAAAWWYPFLVEPLVKTNRWSSESFVEFVRLMEEEGLEFITMRAGREYLKRACKAPGWSESINHFRITRFPTASPTLLILKSLIEIEKLQSIFSKSAGSDRDFIF